MLSFLSRSLILDSDFLAYPSENFAIFSLTRVEVKQARVDFRFIIEIVSSSASDRELSSGLASSNSFA